MQFCGLNSGTFVLVVHLCVASCNEVLLADGGDRKTSWLDESRCMLGRHVIPFTLDS
jgi:hypothetical protein